MTRAAAAVPPLQALRADRDAHAAECVRLRQELAAAATRPAEAADGHHHEHTHAGATTTTRPERADGERLIAWTGERCVPWTEDLQVVYEHYHRYLLAAHVLAAAGPPRRVLDLASGEGYGAALLARRGHEVVGLELDPTAVRHAAQTYAGAAAALSFEQGSMLDLSRYPDGSFDAVTCYEALEHVVEHDTLLAEVTRVLSPDGLFLVSSPDRTVYTETLHQDNPFHVRELDRGELLALLHPAFPAVALWGQTVAVGSLIVPYDGLAPAAPSQLVTLAADDPGSPGTWEEVPPVRSTYLLAVASRGTLPPLPPVSVLVDADFTLVRRTTGERDAALARVAAEA